MKGMIRVILRNEAIEQFIIVASVLMSGLIERIKQAKEHARGSCHLHPELVSLSTLGPRSLGLRFPPEPNVFRRKTPGVGSRPTLLSATPG